MPYNVLDVARFIVNLSNEKFQKRGMSNLRLQKILYFVQARFLVEKGEVCFKEELKAWNFGPVVEEAYHAFKQFGACNIPSIPIKGDGNIWVSESKKFDENVISQSDKDLIEKVLASSEKYSTSNLVEITHYQSPWREAYEENKNNTIKLKSIKDYFS